MKPIIENEKTVSFPVPSIDKKGTMETFNKGKQIDATKNLAATEYSKDNSQKNIHAKTWNQSMLKSELGASYDPKMERQVLLNYSTVEYLCKNVKAKRGLSWILSLRNERIPLPPLQKLGEIHTPAFFEQDMERWKAKFEESTKKTKDYLAKVNRYYHIDLNSSKAAANKTYSKFSTIDSELLKGNSSPVSSYASLINLSMNMF